jgi:GNAT superfamily N-acetyltransferase
VRVCGQAGASQHRHPEIDGVLLPCSHSRAGTLCSMIEVVIRQAEDADLAAVALLRRQWTQEQGGASDGPGFDERFAVWFARESSRRIIWLAEADNGLVGMMNLVVFERMPRPGRAPSRWGYLGNAFVLAAYRNQGIGGQLLSALLGYADENGFVRVVLSPSERSVPFYERAGFRPADALMLRTPPNTTVSLPRST